MGIFPEEQVVPPLTNAFFNGRPDLPRHTVGMTFNLIAMVVTCCNLC